MLTIPILLGLVLFVVVVASNSMKKKARISESAYQSILSAASIVVTIGALLVLFLRLRAR
jgi:hypothetical protein